MAKSKARFLAELLSSDGKVIKTKSQASTIESSDLPTITNSKLEHSSVTIAGESLSLGASLTLDTSNISEHTAYEYFTDAKARSAISATGSLSYNSSTGVMSFSMPDQNTSAITEGTNLYYTDARVDTRLVARGSANWNTAYGWGNHASVGYTTTDTTYSVGDGSLTEINFTSADNTKLDGIATSANNYSHPSAHPISFITGLQTALNGKVDDSQVLTNVPSGALFTDTNTTYSVGDGGLTQINFTTALNTKLAGIAASANNYVLPFTNNSTNWNTAYGWGNHASAGYDVLTATATLSGLKTFTNAAGIKYSGAAASPLWLDRSGTNVNIRLSSSSGTTYVGQGLSSGTLRVGTTADLQGSGNEVWHYGTLTTTNKSNYDTAYGWGNHASESYATESYVDTEISNLVDSSPAALDTLNELAAALGDDPNFATTVNSNIASKLPLAGGTLTGNLGINANVGGFALNVYHTTNYEPVLFQTNQGGSLARFKDNTAQIEIGVQNGNPVIRTSNLARLTVSGADVLINSGALKMGSTTVIDSSRNLTNIGTISSGAITSTGAITSADFFKATGGNLKFSAGGNHIFNVDLNGKIYPQTHNAVDIGFSNTTAFRNLYLSGTVNSTSGNYTTTSACNTFTTQYGNIQLGPMNGSWAHIYTNIAAGFYFNKEMRVNNNLVYNAGNDGSGSGLDADLLDGQQGSYYYAASNPNGYTSNVGDITGVTAGAGLTGGGTSGTPTLNVVGGDGIIANADNITVDSTVFRNNGAQYLQHNTTSSEALTFKNSTSGGLIQIGFQQNDTDGMHHRAYLKAWKGSATASGNVDLIVRGSGGSLTSDILSLRSGNASPTWRGQTIWNAGNDGSGSGLDADLLDGQQGSYYAPKTGVGASGTWPIAIGGNAASANAVSMSANRGDTAPYQVLWGTPGSTSQLYSTAGVKIRSSDATLWAWHYRGAGNVDGTGEASHHPAGIYSQGNNWLYGQIIMSNNPISGVTTLNGGTPWQSSNDGSGSGLDADLLDGQQGSYYYSSANKPAVADVTGIIEGTSFGGTYPIVFNIGGANRLFSENNITYTGNTNTLNINGNTAWHSGNDGSGSGLDADLLDGQQGSYYAAASHVHSYLPINNPTATGTLVSPIIRAGKSQTQGNYTTAALWTESYSSTNTGIAFHISGNVGKMLDMRTDGHLYWENGRVWSATSDGAGSGLDADLLDGLNASSSVVANTIVARQANGYIYANHINFSTSETENPPINSFFVSNGDGWSRKASKSHVISQLGLWTTSNDGGGSGLDADLLDGLQPSALSVAYAGNAGYAGYIPPLYAGGQQTNPQTYFSHTVGLKVAMTGYPNVWSDTLWINGYAGADVVNMCALHTIRNGQPRMWISSQSNRGTSYGTAYEFWSSYNDGSGSGLDADLLDGQQGSYYAAASHNHSGVYLPISGKAADSNLFDGIDSVRMVHGSGGARTDGSTNVSPTTSATWMPSGFYENSNGSGTPSSTWYNVIQMRHTNTGNNHGHQIAGSFYSNDLYNRNISNNSYGAWSKSWSQNNDGAGSGLDADLLDGQQGSYYAPATGGSYLPLSGGTLTGQLLRSAHNTGFFVGGHQNIGNTAAQSSPIYTIGSSYVPATTTLGNMYGIGFTNSNNASFITGDLDTGGTGWGMYVAADGDARIFFNGSEGTITSIGQHYAAGSVVWNAGNDGAGSGLDADLLDGQQGSYYINTANIGSQTVNNSNLLDGIDSTAFLRSNAADSFSGTITMATQVALVANNYGRGVFGLYSATRYQHVWSMGAAYKTSDDGTSAGNIYGLTWSHSNAGTGTNQSIAGLSHQLQLRENGALKCAFGIGIWTSGNVTAYSDISVKTNLVRIPNALEKVCSINGYTYDRTDYEVDPETGIMPDVRQAGVVAQEVEKVLPEVVSGEEGNKAVAYGNMVALMIEAIKELKEEVDDLKKQLKGK